MDSSNSAALYTLMLDCIITGGLGGGGGLSLFMCGLGSCIFGFDDWICSRGKGSLEDGDRDLFSEAFLKGTFGLYIEDVSRSPKLLSIEGSLSSKLTSSSSSSILVLKVLDFLDKSKPVLPLFFSSFEYAFSTFLARSRADSPGIDGRLEHTNMKRLNFSVKVEMSSLHLCDITVLLVEVWALVYLYACFFVHSLDLPYMPL